MKTLLEYFIIGGDSVKKLALFFLILVVILMNYLASTVHQLIKETLWPQWPMCLILYSMLHATFLFLFFFKCGSV